MHSKIITYSLILTLLVASCSVGVQKENLALKAELESLKQENEMLAAGAFNMAHSIEHYHETLQQINTQLAVIDEKKELIKSKSAEFKNDAQVEEEIKLHLEHIHEMTENSKHKIAHMSRNMDMLRRDDIDSHQKIHELENEVHDLAKVIVIRDQEINNLHNMVIGEGITITALADAYNEQVAYSDVLLEIINTGFFVAATEKELKEMGIIDMEGGFIGIGRVKSLNAHAPVQFLTPIDIRDTDLIELTGKRAELITPHPMESYEFTFEKDKEQVFLGIANKLKFWQETNYLVVEIMN